MVEVFEIRLAKSLKLLESYFRLEGARVSKETKKASKECNFGAHCEELTNRLADVRKIGANDTSASDALPDGIRSLMVHQM